MKTITTIFTNYEDLGVWLDEKCKENGLSVLIQFFCELNSCETMNEIAEFLTFHMPSAQIIGVFTGDGDADESDKKITINCTFLDEDSCHFIAIYPTKDKRGDDLKKEDKYKLTNQNNKLMQMGEMIGMIAHQWRQPLNSISATSINISLLSAMGELTENEIKENTKYIQDQCQSMSDTIDTFMNFVKPAKEAKPFRLRETISSIMTIVGSQLLNHNIRVDFTTSNENISIVGHQDLLEQVLLNLLTNARDAFEPLSIPTKFIHISIDILDDSPRIIVEDNAGGVPKEARDKIFNPYFSTKGQKKGTGLGLYMSIDIMKKSFAGDLIHKSIENGSRFELYFNNK